MAGSLLVDLNADLGERFDGWEPGDDQAMLDVVTTAHIACGFHSGGPQVMVETVRAAAERGVSIGAHPSYPDREGFGRLPMDLTPEEIRADVLYQVAALEGIARAAGTRLGSVKPHGALYHRMATDRGCAAAVAGAVRDLDPGLWLVTPAGSTATGVARGLGLRVAEEAFCDRGYLPDGTLAPRGTSGALVTDAAKAGERALRLVRDHELEASDGTTLRISPTTLCVHGDTPAAAMLARSVRGSLEAAGVTVQAFGIR